MRSVPVLMYHHVLPGKGFITSSVEEFESQMRWIAEKGWTTLDAETFRLYKLGQMEIPKKSLLLTFDDGWRDNFIYAYPILKKYGLRATLFLVTGWIDASSGSPETFVPCTHQVCKHIASDHPGRIFLTWDEVRQMRDVFDFHSHTHTHRDNYFGALPWDDDLALAKSRLKEELGIETHHLCWPRGRHDDHLVRKALEMEYEILYTTIRGINLPDGQTGSIKRIAAKKDAGWLAKTLMIFSNPIAGALYARLK